MAYTLAIYCGETEVGTLKQNPATGQLSIIYLPEWQQSGFAISPVLQLDNQYPVNAVYNYLDNLLPEGRARALLAETLALSESQIYPQIRALGRDLCGAFSFHISPPEHSPQPLFRKLSDDELEKRLSEKEQFGLLQWDDKPRLSVAGVQDKLNLFVNSKGEFGFGDGAYCSTHILKFERPNCPYLVLNEYVCMKLSEAVGLPTAAVALKRFGKHPALLVKRFDRRFDSASNRVQRRHVIDACQALNLPREYKYERNLGDGRDVAHIRDGASLVRLFELCGQTSSPVASIQWLVNWQLFNLMISNYDSHGKNLSFYLSKGRYQFTPAYDLVNVAMFDQFKHQLAMAMGDEFDPQDIHAYQLADFAETCGLDKKLLARMLTELANKVLAQLASKRFLSGVHESQQLLSDEQEYIDLLIDNIRERTAYLLSQAEQIPSIVV